MLSPKIIALTLTFLPNFTLIFNYLLNISTGISNFHVQNYVLLFHPHKSASLSITSILVRPSLSFRQEFRILLYSNMSITLPLSSTSFVFKIYLNLNMYKHIYHY
jgi:hypothetical protein